MSHSSTTGLNGHPFPLWREGLLCSKQMYQSTVLSTISNVYRLGTLYGAPANSPLGIALNNLASHKLVSKCIKIKGLGSTLGTTVRQKRH